MAHYRRILCFAAVLLAAGRLSANGPNLVSNPGFDSNIGGWAGDGTWAPSDAKGNVHSGSLRMVNALQNNGTISIQCVAVTAGTFYTVGASAWIDPGGPPTSNAVLVVVFFASTDCTGSFVGGEPSSATTSSNHWVDLGVSFRAPAQARSAHVLLEGNRGAGSPALTLTVYWDNVFLATGECTPSFNQLCLNHGRFEALATWTRPDNTSGEGMAIPLSDDSGGFWFFDPTNVEMDVKVLNACVPALGNRYWVFAAGLTNVKVTLTVIDIPTGAVATYVNPQGKVFQPITDTNAFATCP